MENKIRRKKYLIDKRLQIRYLLMIASSFLLLGVIIFTGIYFGVLRMMKQEFTAEQIAQNLEISRRIYEYHQARKIYPDKYSERRLDQADLFARYESEQISRMLASVQKRIVAISIAFLIFICLASMFLSHKIAGPIYHLKNDIRRVLEGDFTTRTYFRKSDELQDIATDFNNLIESIETLIVKNKAVLNTLMGARARLSSVPALKKEIPEIDDALNAGIVQMVEQFGNYKTRIT